MKKQHMLSIGSVPKALLVINVIMSFIYFAWWFIPGHIDNVFLYVSLFIGEVYHMTMALTFWATIWPSKKKNIIYLGTSHKKFSIDIFITIAGEPISIIRQTAIAAIKMSGYKTKIFLLNDGFVMHKDNWQEVENLADELNIECITRQIPGGAKAGNINNAMRQTTGDIIAIFDADMVAYPAFLKKTVPFFQDQKIGFVQTPQFYKNSQNNTITAGAWEQQEFFFGSIMQGKNNSNAAFICGTNVAIRRQTLLEVGGMNEDNIAEDFLTSLEIHQRGWNSHYLTEVLSEGLAPEDLLSYYKQQLRWARGSLEVLFGQNPLFKAGLTFRQKIQYLSSALYYFNSVIVIIDILVPVVFLYTGKQTVSASTISFAFNFIAFMFLNLYTLFLSSKGSMKFRAISFSQASFFLQFQALISVLFKRKTSFSVTPKQAQEGNFLFLALPHIIYTLVGFIGIAVGIHREGIDPSITTNMAWVLFNVILFSPFIFAALPWKMVIQTMIHTKQSKVQITI